MESTYFYFNKEKKRGKKHSFNKWDLSSFDKALLSSLTAAATYEGVRLFFFFSNITAEHLATEEKQESHHEKLWQLSLWRAVWLSLGSSNHSPHHCCGLWAGHNATLTRAAREMKQQAAQQLPKPVIYPIHRGKIARFPSIFSSFYKNKKSYKSLGPQGRLTLISTTQIPRCVV